ncbi:uncharacterized protein OCT59_017820 [Rhizophagus irregularis]|nr:hypothetical protein OCT59_017820 [Rhizophagus irregularis]CAG8544858.1 6968_t:CDS:2 [Rhizophagus irregularis]
MPMSKGTNLEKPSKINNSDKQCIFNNFIYKENCLTIASNDTTVDNSDVRRRSISPTEDLSSQNLEGCKNPTITIAMVDSGAVKTIMSKEFFIKQQFIASKFQQQKMPQNAAFNTSI